MTDGGIDTVGGAAAQAPPPSAGCKVVPSPTVPIPQVEDELTLRT